MINSSTISDYEMLKLILDTKSKSGVVLSQSMTIKMLKYVKSLNAN